MRLSMGKAADIRTNRRGSVWRISGTSDRPEGHGHAGPAFTPVYVERDMPADGFAEYQALRQQGGRAFVLWADPDRRRVFARVVTKSAERRGSAHFDILGAAGEPVGTVVREPGCRGGRIRTHWTVTQVGREPLVGHKGQSGWWVVWWLFFPVQLALGVFIVASIFLGGGDGDLARMPRRIRWRDDANGTVPLDYSDDVLRVDGHWDPRLVSSLLALLATYPGLLGTSAWDTGRD